jgi:hypothetical protein
MLTSRGVRSSRLQHLQTFRHEVRSFVLMFLEGKYDMCEEVVIDCTAFDRTNCNLRTNRLLLKHSTCDGSFRCGVVNHSSTEESAAVTQFPFGELLEVAYHEVGQTFKPVTNALCDALVEGRSSPTLRLVLAKPRGSCLLSNK